MSSSSVKQASRGAHVGADDVSGDLQAYLRERIAKDQLQGIELRLVPCDSPALKEAGVDLLFLANTCRHTARRSRARTLLPMPGPVRAIVMLLGLVLCMPVPAQFKYEHEERMASEDVPDAARAVVDGLELQGRVRWYREQGYDRTSIEAKVRHRGQRYSIEFGATGTFEDVEVEVKTREVPEAVWARIAAQLSDSLGRHRVQKVQVRYTGAAEEVGRHLRQGAGADLPTGYELMVSSREEGTYVLFEYEFTADGAFVRRDRVVLRHADHIMY